MEDRIKELLGAATSELESLLGTKNVVGDPIQLGEHTVLPIVSVGFGMAVAGANSHGRKSGDGGGAGLGCGGGVKPLAVIISGPDGVRVETIKGGAASAAETIAETVAKLLRSQTDNDES